MKPFGRKRPRDKQKDIHHETIGLSVDEDRSLSLNVHQNERMLRDIFQNCSDVVFRSISMKNSASMLMVYIDGLVDKEVLEEAVLQRLVLQPQGSNSESLGTRLSQQLVAIADTKTVLKLHQVVRGIVKAKVALMADGENTALIASVQKFQQRAVEEPSNEAAIRGPRDSFTETLRVNTMLLRRRIASPRLKMESFTVGELTQTDVVLAYMDGLAVHSVLQEVRNRIRDICMKGILGAGYVEENIQDYPLSPFPQVQNTERPDVAVSSLLEGKVAIVTDGTPFVLILPTTFWAGLQAADDHYERFLYSVFRRAVRYIMAIISLVLPATYVGLTTFNPSMLPDRLVQSISTAREITPFPTVIETILMEIVFEGLQEAGIRLPHQMGPIVSIVGALVIGEAAVRANIVSAPIVIVVALTGIASYAMPRYSFGVPFRMLRFGLVILAGIFGLYGVAVGITLILIHLVTLESFGVPYFTPVAPLVLYHLRDVLLRTPRWNKNWLQRRHEG